MEKPSRPQRNRRHSRRAWPPEDDVHQPRPAKRLFTPEIKRMLKDWLVRRRENPYPSRDEKKRLAYDTGLTYTQICNWFANWRRKLKNSERERVQRSWGHLIKNYNTNAKGNVEQFSICSEDSIWEEAFNLRASDEESRDEGSSGAELGDKNGVGHSRLQRYEIPYKPNFYMSANRLQHKNCYAAQAAVSASTQCYQHLLPAESPQIQNGQHTNFNSNSTDNTFSAHKAKYKQKIMEKYLREEHVGEQTTPQVVPPANTIAGGAELSKWLESAVKFTPDKNNYFVEWHNKRNKLESKHDFKQPQRVSCMNDTINPLRRVYATLHHKDELDAAEALANLAFNCRQRMLNTTAVLQAPINAIGS